jgi:hypothetical protein
MLITFKSKAAAEVLMYAKHAKPLLDLLDKQVERGVITAEEMGGAIQRIESEIAMREQAETIHDHDAHDRSDESDTVRGDHVSFSTRAYPLLEMLRAANREHEFVMWGV